MKCGLPLATMSRNKRLRALALAVPLFGAPARGQQASLAESEGVPSRKS